MSYQNGPRIVTSGLVLCLDAGNSKSYPGSGTAWNDLSGNGNNGTLTNGPTYSSANKGSIVFDGTNDYVTCGSGTSLQITTEVTITSIVKAPVTGANKQRLIDSSMTALKIGTTSPYQDISFFMVNTSGTRFEVRKSNSIITSNSLPYIISARWRKSDGSAAIFVNGIETSYAVTYSFTNTVNTLTSDLTIGYLPGFNIYGNQQIYATHIYNRYLSNMEITQNYNALKGRFGL